MKVFLYTNPLGTNPPTDMSYNPWIWHNMCTYIHIYHSPPTARGGGVNALANASVNYASFFLHPSLLLTLL